MLQFTLWDDLSEVHSFCFEAICKERRGTWHDQQHLELAMSYPRHRLVFLGVSLVDRRFYLPHPLYTRLSRKPLPFEEPLWWHITSATQLDAMMAGLNQLLLQEINNDEWLQKFPPSSVSQSSSPSALSSPPSAQASSSSSSLSLPSPN